ncbi:MAG: sugar ABC transporter ATP-binding protein [Planctomyces sp.]|nr:sugar ABC transporter ATP-binding protein [Planctomyces sp.]
MLSRVMLRTEGISKKFAAPVLRGIELNVNQGEVHALLGANGAGKSTLCRIISGLLWADSGRMFLDGKEFTSTTRQDAEQRGIQIVQQELNLLPTLTVAENMFLDRMPCRFGWIDRRELNRRAQAAMDALNLSQIDVRTQVSELGVGQRQLVEIAGALSRSCRLLILDEPTAALTATETERLFEQLRRLKSEGTGVIYISHRLEEIRQIADRISVLRDGRLITTQPVDELSTDEIVSLMTGAEPEVVEGVSGNTHGAGTGSSSVSERKLKGTALRVSGLSVEGRLTDVNFTLYEGERLGVAGLVGAGRTEMLRALFGDLRTDGGMIRVGDGIDRQPFEYPRDAVRAGFAMVTEDRKADGLMLSMSIRENTVLPVRRKLAWHGTLVRRRSEVAVTEAMRDSLGVISQSVEQPVDELSGGNQQKVILGKWLLTAPRILLLDEPTRGIDVPARMTILKQLNQLAERGTAILMVSSDLDELMQFCDRILVLSVGKISGDFRRDAWTKELLMQACFRGHVGLSGGSQ